MVGPAGDTSTQLVPVKLGFISNRQPVWSEGQDNVRLVPFAFHKRFGGMVETAVNTASVPSVERRLVQARPLPNGGRFVAANVPLKLPAEKI